MIYVDPPRWPARGRLWSHLISDVGYAELHAFAEALGAPRRAFERDHYDLPAERFPCAVWLGARVVTSREIVERLRAAGLRRRRAGTLLQTRTRTRRHEPKRRFPDAD
jgi:uncharacterized protein DUF4031